MKKLICVSILLVTFLTTYAQEWKKYKYEDLECIAYFPAEPVRTVQKIDTALGELDMYMVATESKAVNDNSYYAFIRSEYPKEGFTNLSKDKIDSILDGAVEGAVTNVQGTLIKDENITLNGFPGRSIIIKIEGADLYMQNFLVENTMYVIQVIAEEGKLNIKSIENFFDAFDIIKVK